MDITIIVLIILAVIILYLIAGYNKLVKLKNRAQEGEADIDVQLKRRHNLIPNMVQTVKGYAAHEKGVFEKVTLARTQAMSSGTLKDKATNENMLTNTLKSLFAVAEAYPDLKANANFLELQRELSDTEDKIQASRRFYNGVVRDFNTAIASFPTNIMADMFHFKIRGFFELDDEAAREVPKVNF